MGQYYLDLETLEIKPKRFSFKEFLLKSAPFLVITFSLSIILTAFLITKVPTPLEYKLVQRKQAYVHKFLQLDQKLHVLNQKLISLATTDDHVYRSIYGLGPVPQWWRYAGIGGNVAPEFSNTSKLVKSTDLKLKLIAKQIEIQANSYKELINIIKKKELMASCIPAIQPIAIDQLIRFGSPFGYRMHPILHVIKMHTGIDLVALRGTPVYATGDGIVIRADAASRGYGNHIRIAHGFGYITLYAHLSKILVHPGQVVHRGDLIGLVGSTGLSTAPHLHYEVRINNKPVNPINFIYNDMTDKEYNMMIEQVKKADTHIFE